MIQNANNTLLTNTNAALPNMSNTISSWFLNITIETVERVLDGADWTEVVTGRVNTKGVVQPPTDEHLKIMPEGAWEWEALMLHCLPNANFQVNQYIKYDGITFKIMSKKDWQKYGYIEYVIVEAFKADNL